MEYTQDGIRDRSEQNEEGCWIWQRSKFKNGYGQWGRGLYAHRLSYEAFRGEVPDGFQIDHICTVKACVNPDHLEAVTQGENLRRSYERGERTQWQKSKTHCKHGHPLEGENLYEYKGYRYCKTCRRDSVRRARLR